MQSNENKTSTSNQVVNSLLSFMSEEGKEITEIKLELTYYNYFILGYSNPSKWSDEEAIKYIDKYKPNHVPLFTQERFIEIQQSKDSSNNLLWKTWFYEPYVHNGTQMIPKSFDILTLPKMETLFNKIGNELMTITPAKIKERYYNMNNYEELQKIASFYASGKFVIYNEDYIKQITNGFNPITGELSGKQVSQLTLTRGQLVYMTFTQYIKNILIDKSIWNTTADDEVEEQTRYDINPFYGTYLLYYLRSYCKLYQSQYKNSGNYTYKDLWNSPFYYKIVFEDDYDELNDVSIRSALKVGLKEKLQNIMKSYEEKYNQFLEMLSNVRELTICSNVIDINNVIMFEAAGIDILSSCSINKSNDNVSDNKSNDNDVTDNIVEENEKITIDNDKNIENTNNTEQDTEQEIIDNINTDNANKENDKQKIIIIVSVVVSIVVLFIIILSTTLSIKLLKKNNSTNVNTLNLS